MPAAKPIADNPHGPAFDSLEDDGRRYLVVNTAVGVHRQDAMVSARDLGPGAQIPRLLRLGAIRELSPAEIDDREAAELDDPTLAARNEPITPQDATGNPHPHDLPPGATAKPAAPLAVNPPAAPAKPAPAVHTPPK